MLPERATRAGLALITVLIVSAALAACGQGPIVARRPGDLYSLAKEQLNYANYGPAADGLAKAAREAPASESGRRAQVLRLALLTGMARAYQELGQDLWAGYQQEGDAPGAPALRSQAMDYFSRARLRSSDLLDDLQQLLRDKAAGPWQLDLTLPPPAGVAAAVRADLRAAKPVDEKTMDKAEQEVVLGGLVEALGKMMGGASPEQVRQRLDGSVVELQPAAVYLAVAEEVSELSNIYGPDAMRQPRFARFYLEQAMGAAARAAELANTAGQTRLADESKQFQQRCQEVIGKL